MGVILWSLHLITFVFANVPLMCFRAKLAPFVADNKTVTLLTMVIRGFFFRLPLSMQSLQQLCVLALMLSLFFRSLDVENCPMPWNCLWVLLKWINYAVKIANYQLTCLSKKAMGIINTDISANMTSWNYKSQCGFEQNKLFATYFFVVLHSNMFYRHGLLITHFNANKWRHIGWKIWNYFSPSFNRTLKVRELCVNVLHSRFFVGCKCKNVFTYLKNLLLFNT